MLLHYNNVEIRHDDALILSNVNLTVNEGDYVFITGKVGSGKSTLLSTIYGELCPTGGEATVLGFDMFKIKPRQLPELRKQLGMDLASGEDLFMLQSSFKVLMSLGMFTPRLRLTREQMRG